MVPVFIMPISSPQRLSLGHLNYRGLDPLNPGLSVEKLQGFPSVAEADAVPSVCTPHGAEALKIAATSRTVLN